MFNEAIALLVEDEVLADEPPEEPVEPPPVEEEKEEEPSVEEEVVEAVPSDARTQAWEALEQQRKDAAKTVLDMLVHAWGGGGTHTTFSLIFQCW